MKCKIFNLSNIFEQYFWHYQTFISVPLFANDNNYDDGTKNIIFIINNKQQINCFL